MSPTRDEIERQLCDLHDQWCDWNDTLDCSENCVVSITIDRLIDYGWLQVADSR